MRPYQTFHVLAELRNSSVAHLSRKGVRLSSNDSQTVLDVYQQWLLLMIDLDYLHPDTLSRDAQRLWSDILLADVYDLNSALAECLQLVRLQTNKGFKGLCKRISSHLYPKIKNDIELMQSGDVLSAKRLTQLFSYTGRLSLSDIDLTQQLLGDYLAIEEAMKPIGAMDQSLLASLNKIIRGWLGPHVPASIIPRHSGGGVAGVGRTSLEAKYKLLVSDKRLEFAFGSPSWHAGVDSEDLIRISQTIFVPKSYKTFRTISMEPATLMYFQQGVWNVLDHQVKWNGYLRSHIDFHVQTRNQDLAKAGSIDRNYATLDLSSASDSVSYDLVKRLFRGTWLLRYQIATRSVWTKLPNKRTIRLKKFAPMGSALCFPTETILFAAICEHVTRMNRAFGDYSVYGDDIIVPTKCADATMSVLAELGFTVNRDKSFYDKACWFRESCGGEFCDGYDVTPMRVSRKYNSRKDDVRLAKLIEMANNAYNRGFKNLRHFFIAKMRESNYVVHYSETSLLSDNYTNYHTGKRWNKAFQIAETRASAQVPTYGEKNVDLESQDEWIRYRHWWELAEIRKYDAQLRFSKVKNRNYRKFLIDRAGCYAVGDGLKSIVCQSTVEVKMAWYMKPYVDLDQDYIDFKLGRGKYLPL